jgi:cell division protein FtsB
LLAAELLAKGEIPSSRKIRDMLGEGSLSTITDELKQWEAEQRVARKATVAQSLGLLPDGENLPSTQEEEQRNEPLELPSSSTESGVSMDPAWGARVVAELERNNKELANLRAELATLRASHDQQLRLAYERFEAVQRHALLQVDEARRDAADLREKLSNARLDAQVKEDAVKAKSQKLRDENAVLTAKVEVLEELLVKNGVNV